jgi:benzoyl-CoA reductase/2-hydroxyglutaryl-CoA dehydratase subunit BcrC/BadD/HgdB
MKTLDNNWMTENPLDFEHKKYVLLDYLQHCKHHFDQTKLYPPLSDLLKHYHNLNELKTEFNQIKQSFPKEFSGLDFKKLKLQYEQQLHDDESMQTLNEIVEFALPSIKTTIEDGRMLYDYVEQNIEITPVGIVPVYNSEGYMLLHEDKSHDVHIYQYQYSAIQSPTEKVRALSLQYLFKEVRSLSNTIESIKLNLIHKFKNLPQPATYLCVSRINIPMVETLLPVAKRVMMTRILG